MMFNKLFLASPATAGCKRNYGQTCPLFNHSCIKPNYNQTSIEERQDCSDINPCISIPIQQMLQYRISFACLKENSLVNNSMF